MPSREKDTWFEENELTRSTEGSPVRSQDKRRSRSAGENTKKPLRNV